MPILLILIAIVSIQVGASFAKGLFPVLGPAGGTTLRIFFAAILMTLIQRPWRRSWSREDFFTVGAYGVALGVMNLTFYFALARLPLGLAVAIEFVGPLSVALFASRRAIDFLWAVLAAVGIVLVLPLRGVSAGVDWIGVGLALCAGACWAAYILIGKRASALVPAGMATAVGMIVALMVALPVGVIEAGATLLRVEYYPQAFAVAMLSSAIPYTLEMFALKQLTAKNFGILLSLEPAVAAIAGGVVLGEQLTAVQWLAVVLVGIASAGSSMTSASPQPLDAQPAA